MILRSPTEHENGVCPSTPNSPTSPSFPHVFSGNPGEIRTGPPIKTFGGDGLGSRISSPQLQFSKENTKATKMIGRAQHVVPLRGSLLLAVFFRFYRPPNSFSVSSTSEGSTTIWGVTDAGICLASFSICSKMSTPSSGTRPSRLKALTTTS